MLDATVWPTVGAGCHAHRDTRTAIEEAGFTIEYLEHPASPRDHHLRTDLPHILGAATKTEG